MSEILENSKVACNDGEIYCDDVGYANDVLSIAPITGRGQLAECTETEKGE